MRVRRKDGNEYPAKTLYYISCGILRYLRDHEIYDKNFPDAADPRFAGFRKILDSKMKDALSRGVGGKRKQADPILPEDEATIWEKGIFGMNNAETLQNTVFFYSCKFFGLRGHDEHHSLQCDQFFLGEDNRGKYIEFTGRSTKTFKGGLAHKELHNKQIRHYCQPGERCMADYFKVHLDALGNEGSFYRRPLAGSPPRYGSQLVGVNKLKSMMKVICEKAGLKGNYANHSGKRTCATALYQNGVDEQEIMGRTGHRSEVGVRAYKHGNAEIACTVSKVLNPPEPKLPKMEPKDASGPLMDISTSNEINIPDKVEVLGQTVGGSTFNNCPFISY
ncbi:uncharacterized protein LOC134282241 [Saccostrea cucullata]|uniref:uncharacterized protein LOC134282241 n=1 Tax=Saccostrea cuccullata TaxID=36930 RepID=UPI002ED03D5F